MEKATESNVSNTGKTRNEWWRKRREEPHKVRAKISHETIVKRRQKAAARQKDERYVAALNSFFATGRLRKLIQKAAKTGGVDGINKARIRIGLPAIERRGNAEVGL